MTIIATIVTSLVLLLSPIQNPTSSQPETETDPDIIIITDVDGL